MLSRVAENLFWMSRYLERAENVARLLDIGLYLELDAPSTAGDDGSAPVEIALAHPRLPRGVPRRRIPAVRPQRGARLSDVRPDQPAVDPEHDRAGPRKRPRHPGKPGRRRLERGQPALPLPLRPAGPAAGFTPSPSAFYATIKQSCILFDGLVQNTLPRDEVYHFLRAGPLSRAGQRDGPDPPRQVPEPSRGRRAAVDPAMRAGPLDGLLRSCSAYGAYLRVERDRVEPVGVIRFLVLNPDFPRAIRFCVARCRESLQEIAGGDDDEYASEAERLLGRLDSELRYIDVGEIFERGLLPFLDGIQTTCAARRRGDPAVVLS